VRSRTVDTTVQRIRTKLGPDRDVLGSIRGVGYRLEVIEPSSDGALAQVTELDPLAADTPAAVRAHLDELVEIARSGQGSDAVAATVALFPVLNGTVPLRLELEILSRAIGLASSTTRPTLLLRRARSRLALGHTERAAADLDDVEVLGPLQAAEKLRLQALLRRVGADCSVPWSALRQAAELLDTVPESSGRDDLRAMVFIARGRMKMAMADLDGAELEFRQAVRVWQLGQLSHRTAPALTSLAVLCERRERFVEARSLMRRALATAEGAGEPLLRRVAQAKLVTMWLNHGQLELAEQGARALIDELDDYDPTAGSSDFCRGVLGAILLEQGRLDEAFDEIDAARQAYDRAGRFFGRVDTTSDLARICHLRGAVAEAEALLEGAIDAFGDRIVAPRWQLHALRALARADLGDLVGVEEDLAWVDELPRPTWIAELMERIARAWLGLRRGQTTEAREELRSLQQDARVCHSHLVRVALAQLETAAS